MNLFGFDVRSLDVEALTARAHLIWWLLSGIAAWLAWRDHRSRERGKPWRNVLLLGVAGHFLAWFITMFPLPNLYGVNGSLDRENHLGWVQVIVAGNSPIRSFQVGQIHFEPLWPNLVALASLYRADLIGVVMQIAPLIVGVLFLLSVFACLSRGLGDTDDARLEAAFAGFFALLLASTWADQTAPFRNPWALTFILKPNHALGLVFTPIVLLAMARAHDWTSRILAGVLLQLLGWIFVIHMAFVISGFFVFAAWTWLQRRPERARVVVDVAAVTIIGVVLVSPYFYMLREFVGATTVAARLGIQPQSAHTLDGTIRLGLLFPLALFGVWSLARGESILGRLLASQFVAAQVNWQIFHVLGIFELGKEMDEGFYWIRFVTALVAGVGFCRLARIAAPRLARLALSAFDERARFAATVAGLLLIAAPSALPGWWDPARLDRYFTAALRDSPPRVEAPAAFLREKTDVKAVVVADRVYARYVAAFGARRVLLAESLNPPGDFARRVAIEGAVLRGEPAALIEEGRQRYELRYLLVTPALLADHPGVSLEALQGRADLRQVFQHGAGEDLVTIFELVPPGRP
jgi:hypothetical protein